MLIYKTLKKKKITGNFIVVSYMIQNVLQEDFAKKFQNKI